MGCSKPLDFEAPPAAGAHLSFYWTMDEAGDLNKIDSTVGHAWNATTGNLSPPGKFSNGIQLDCVFVGGPPFFHGLVNGNDPAFAINHATATGLSVCFWINKTVDPAGPASLWQWFIDCHNPGFTVETELLLFTDFAGLMSYRHEDFTNSISVTGTFPFAPVTGTWHMIVDR